MAVLGIAGLATWNAFVSEDTAQVRSYPVAEKVGGLRLEVTTEGEEIFSRAFWRRPNPEDNILQAERRQWSDEEGVRRWQWFLVVEASPSLIGYLLDENAFGLRSTDEVTTFAEVPQWFQYEPMEVSTFASRQSGLYLMYRKADNTLYATGSGTGFTKAVAEPARSAGKVSSQGRLPPTSPPKPKS